MYGNPDLKDEIRKNIERGLFDDALRLCDQLDDSDADYYYFRAWVYTEKGWSQQAREQIRIAMQMEPNRLEYQNLWQRLDQPGKQYKAQSEQQGYVRPCGCCELGGCLCCSDCCCESMGGDLIPCC